MGAALKTIDIVYTVITTPSSESTTTVSTTPTASDEILSREEVEAFRWFIAQLDHPQVASTSSFVHSGTFVSTLTTSFFARSSS